MELNLHTRKCNRVKSSIHFLSKLSTADNHASNEKTHALQNDNKIDIRMGHICGYCTFSITKFHISSSVNNIFFILTRFKLEKELCNN